MRLIDQVRISVNGYLKHFKKNDVDLVFIGLAGSRNFGIHDDDSDYDFKALVLPKESEPINQDEYYMSFFTEAGGVEITVYDIRFLLLNLFHNRYVNVLFSDETYVNPKYANIVSHIQSFVRYNAQKYLHHIYTTNMLSVHTDLANINENPARKLYHAYHTLDFLQRFFYFYTQNNDELNFERAMKRSGNDASVSIMRNIRKNIFSLEESIKRTLTLMSDVEMYLPITVDSMHMPMYDETELYTLLYRAKASEGSEVK